MGKRRPLSSIKNVFLLCFSLWYKWRDKYNTTIILFESERKTILNQFIKKNYQYYNKN